MSKKPSYEELEQKIESLEESQFFFHKLLDMLPELVSYIDDNYVYKFANKKYQDYFNIDSSSMVGLHPRKVLGDEAIDEVASRHAAALSGQEQEYQSSLLLPDGECLFFHAHYLPHVEDGQVRGFLAVVQDITKFKTLENDLRDKEDRLQHLLTNSPAIIYSCKADGDFATTYISPNIYRHLGYEPDEFTANPGFWAERIHPEDKPRVFAELPSVFDQGRHVHEYRFRHKNGTYRWMRDELRLFEHKGDNLNEIIGFWIDITDQKQIETELQQSEQKYHYLFDNLQEGIVLFNQDGVIQLINQRLLKLLGYLREEMEDHSFIDFVLESEREACRIYLEKRINGIEEQHECTLLKKDGTLLHVLAEAQILYGKDDAFEGVLASLMDISRLKSTEAQLRKSGKFIQAILDLTPAIVYLYDIQNDRNIWINPQLKALTSELGVSPEQDRIVDFLHPDDRKVWQDRIRQFTYSPSLSPIDIEYRFRDKNGGWRWFQDRAVVFEWDEEKRIQRIIASAVDITQHKLNLSILNQKESELQDKLREIERKNIALNVLLEYKANEKSNFERNIVANLKTLVFPFLERLRKSRNVGEITDLTETVKQNLEHLISPFAHQLSTAHYYLTPTEIKVANLVAQDKTSKEIAAILNISTKSVAHHRSSIRKKLNLIGTPVNLKTYLASFLENKA